MIVYTTIQGTNDCTPMLLVSPVAGPGSWLLPDGLYRLGLEQVVRGLLPQPGLP